MNYRHMVFDVDGTLLDSAHADLQALQDTVAQLTGRTVPIPELVFSQGIPGPDTLKRLGLDHLPQALPLWMQNVGKYEHTVSLFDGIRETVKALAPQCTLGIVTSRTREELDLLLPRFGLESFFSVTVCTDDTGKHKPDPAPLLQYMALAGASPAETLYVGDSVHDSQCAQAAGVDFALALWGTFDPSIRAEYRLSEPSRLLSLPDRPR